MPSDQNPGLRLATPELAQTGYPSAGVQPKTREAKNQAVVSSPPSLLVDAKTLGGILSVSVATIWRMDASGKMPNSVRPSPGVKRWRRQEIQEWIGAGCPCRKDWEAMKKAGR